ncbi:uncharacterized protein LOC133175896 [Saccostrea echinata]|uniref:uncharacterized protein LOC133175896 n=1 Tax=Saccostrea echinata TaxID=191078 RepID=UPI002A81B13F|nr:uncharacterized protein LOC133175896 [Saccostrea echinata]
MDFNDVIEEEIRKQISPLWAKYSDMEAKNLENQKTIGELQKQILDLKQENDLKTSELYKTSQWLHQLMTTTWEGNESSLDICRYITHQCPSKPRQDRQTSHYVAFSAYIDNLGGNNHVGNTLLYNNVLGNYGNAYNSSSGIFTAPTDGIYAFLWVTAVRHDSWCSTRMLKNGFILSMTSSNAKATGSNSIESGSGTGFLITYMNHGDTAFVEMNNPHSETCNIVSNAKALTTFSGWQITRI